MEIIYCDTCGRRIPPNAVTSGVMRDGKVLCEKCRPASAPAAPTATRRSSGNSHPVVTSPAPQRLGSGASHAAIASAAAQRAPKLFRTATIDKSGPRVSDAQSENGMLVGVGLAGGCVALLGLFFMFSGSSPEKKSTRTAAATTNSQQSTWKTTAPDALPAIQKSPAVTPVLVPVSPLTQAAPAPASSPEPHRAESVEQASKLSTGGLLNNPTGKSDPDSVADAAYDKVLASIAKAEPGGKIKGLEQFIQDVDQNTMAAARARAMLSTLKKAGEAAKAPPAPAQPVQHIATAPALAPSQAVTATPAPSNMGGTAAVGADKVAFKEDFEFTAYGINYGKLSSELPDGRTGKGMKMLGSGGDRRGGIYAYAYPQDSQQFKTNTLAVTSEGMKLKFKYHYTNSMFEIVVGYCPPGTDTICWAKHRPEQMTKGAWSEQEVPLSAFKADGGATVPSNARINRIEFWAYGAGEAYVDDIELTQ